MVVVATEYPLRDEKESKANGATKPATVAAASQIREPFQVNIALTSGVFTSAAKI
jgi:hypothetical protein